MRDPWVPPEVRAKVTKLPPETQGAELQTQVDRKLRARFDAVAKNGRLTREQAREGGLGSIADHFDAIDPRRHPLGTTCASRTATLVSRPLRPPAAGEQASAENRACWVGPLGGPSGRVPSGVGGIGRAVAIRTSTSRDSGSHSTSRRSSEQRSLFMRKR